ncbi:MAG: disulfide bond formation protein B [Dongiaceae bacterium]
MNELTRRAPWFLIAAGVFALGSAFAFQYIGGYAPCVLCIYQRYPYGVVIALGLLALLAWRQPKVAAGLTLLAALALFVDAGIAAFHVGVEQHWWQGTNECTNLIDPNLSIEDLKKALQEQPVVACDQVAWSLFGISMAGYNFLYALAAGIVATVLAFRLFRSPR